MFLPFEVWCLFVMCIYLLGRLWVVLVSFGWLVSLPTRPTVNSRSSFSRTERTQNRLILRSPAGMYLVEIHTIGRVHYMLIEGIGEARAWAAAVQARAGHDERASPQDDLSITDPFSQYMTKKSAWKASNFWVLNCRRVLELNHGGSSSGSANAGWGGGCWMEEGGLGGQVCDFVAGLLRQVILESTLPIMDSCSSHTPPSPQVCNLLRAVQFSLSFLSLNCIVILFLYCFVLVFVVTLMIPSLYTTKHPYSLSCARASQRSVRRPWI